MKLTKCKCYRKSDKWLPWAKGVCKGTKECDPCECEGDRTRCDFYDHVRENATKELKEAVRQQLNSHGKSCVNCLYNDICIPDEMTICTDFKDARRYTRHEFVPGDEAYCVRGTTVYPAHIVRTACDIEEDGTRNEIIRYWYNILNVKIDVVWLVGSRFQKTKALYHTFAEAQAAIKEATKDAKEN